MTPKKSIKKQTSFPQPVTLMCSRYFKINAPLLYCPLFSREYLKPQVRIKKIANYHTVHCHPSPSGLTSRIHRLVSVAPLKFYFSPQNFWFFVKTAIYPTIVGKNFNFLVFILMEKAFGIWKSKKWRRKFYASPMQNSPPGSYHHLPGRGNSLIPPRSIFSKIYPPAERGEETMGINSIWNISAKYPTCSIFHTLIFLLLLSLPELP